MGALGVWTPATQSRPQSAAVIDLVGVRLGSVQQVGAPMIEGSLTLRAPATVEVTVGVRPGACSISGSPGRWDVGTPARQSHPQAPVQITDG